jgi:hypothetical protein
MGNVDFSFRVKLKAKYYVLKAETWISAAALPYQQPRYHISSRFAISAAALPYPN